MKKIHKKILRLCKEKAHRISKDLAYTSKSYVTLSVLDKNDLKYKPTRCFFIKEERKRRDQALAFSYLSPSVIRSVIAKIWPYTLRRNKKHPRRIRCWKQQSFQYKFLASDFMRSSQRSL